ncbi:MAG TPA: 3',5'-nucleoside bisphosphate phosphatase [Burkholderiaceae bacterium]|nr:3',5'-nucleoside bisphosphate phosphatase [Burkholderiaceae bacterium]
MPADSASPSNLAPRRDPRAVRADLHAHSTVSDGALAPAVLVERAATQGVELFALTDHDELDGLAEAASAAERLGLPFVPGVEVSVTWGETTVHIVGLGIDAQAPVLRAGLARVRSGRLERAREIGRQLEVAGVPDAFEGALAHAGNLDLVSRTHFARHLVDTGVCRDVREVFGRFLVEGKPGFVPHRWADLDEALAWIQAAGGVAVLAHPGRYKLGEPALHELMLQFRSQGGTAIEVSTSNHGPAQIVRFAQAARDFGFEASAGSDFHAPGEQAELGAAPPLPADLTPVWHRYV